MASFSVSVREFVWGVFQKTPNFGELTTRQIRNQYLKAKDISTINEEEKEIFRSVVNTVFQEFTFESENNIQNEETGKEKNVFQSLSSSVLEDIFHSDKSSEIKSSQIQNRNDLEEVTDDDFTTENIEETIKVKSQDKNRNCGSPLSDEDESSFSSSPESISSAKVKQQKKDSTSSSPESISSVKVKQQKKVTRFTQDSFENSSDSKSDKSDCELEMKSKSTNELEKLEKVSSQDTIFDSSSSDEFCKSESDKKPETAIKKIQDFDNSSDENFENYELDDVKPNRKRKKAPSKFDDDDSLDSDSELIKYKKQKVSKDDSNSDKKKAAKRRKQSSDSNSQNKTRKESDSEKIERVKKYLRAASIHVQSYSKLWEGCHTQSSKVEKLMELLYDAGLQGTPSLEKCKKLRLEKERQQELASLDTSNIISTEGRGRRNARSLYQQSIIEEKIPTKTFSRLKGIVDSEESD